MKRIPALKKPTNKHVVIVLVVAGLLLPALVAGYHEYRWRYFVDANNTNFSEAKQRSEQLLALDAPTVQVVDQTLVALSAYSTELCSSQPFFTTVRERLFTAAREEIALCEEKKQALTKVEAQLSAIKAYLAADKQVAEAFSQAAGALNKAESGDMLARKTAWEALARTLEQLPSIDERAMSTLEAQQEAVDRIIEGYGALLAADKAQNRSDYDNALKTVKADYKHLQTVVESSQAEYSSIVAELEQSIHTL